MFSTIEENGKTKYSLTQYVADSESDIKDLPTACLPGSICIVIDTADIYMLNNQRQWQKFGG